MCDYVIEFGIKRYEEIRKLTTGQAEDYTPGSLLDYDYIKCHYRLTSVDLSRQNELDSDPNEIQEIEIAGQLKNVDGINADGTQIMFNVAIWKKLKKRD